MLRALRRPAFTLVHEIDQESLDEETVRDDLLPGSVAAERRVRCVLVRDSERIAGEPSDSPLGATPSNGEHHVDHSGPGNVQTFSKHEPGRRGATAPPFPNPRRCCCWGLACLQRCAAASNGAAIDIAVRYKRGSFPVC
jgi:hypothetical protein